MRRSSPFLFWKLSLGTAQILTGTGVDLDLVALVDEQGHLHLSAGLHGSGLGDVGSGVASEARLGSGNNQVSKVGNFNTENLALVGHNGANIIFPNLKYCRPNGIPITVIQRITPDKKFPIAMAIPKKMIQIIFIPTVRQPIFSLFLYLISDPNGAI